MGSNNKLCANNRMNDKLSKRPGEVRQDVVSAARDVSRSTAGCKNPAQDSEGQDRLVSVIDLAWDGLKIGGNMARAALNEMQGDSKAARAARADAERAKHSLNENVKHYGWSDAAVDVAATAFGGGAGRLLFSGAVGLAGKSGAKFAIGKVAAKGSELLGGAAKVLEGNTGKALSHHADDLFTQSKKLKFQAAKAGQEAVTSPIGRQAGGGKLLDKSTVAGISGVAAARQVVGDKTQLTSKASSDLRIEMRQIADALHKQNKPVTTQILVDVHRAIKEQRLDKGEPERQGLDAREKKALTDIVRQVDTQDMTL